MNDMENKCMYVSVFGSDETGDGSKDNPFETLLYAMLSYGKEPFPDFYTNSNDGKDWDLIPRSQVASAKKTWLHLLEKNLSSIKVNIDVNSDDLNSNNDKNVNSNSNIKQNDIIAEKELKMDSSEKLNLMSNFKTVSSIGDFLDSIPVFSGEESGLPLEDYIDRIKMLADHANWSESDKVLVLKLKLSGIAARFIRDNPRLKEEKSFSQILKALRDRFSSIECLHSNLRSFLQSYQRPNESVRQFAARVEASSYKTVMPELLNDKIANQQRLDVLCSVFIEGLKPHFKRLILPQNHKSFDSAKRHAVAEEEVWSKQHGDDPQYVMSFGESENKQLHDELKRNRVEVENLTKKLAELQTQIDSKPQLPQTRLPKDSRRCFSCGLLGHISVNCRKYPQSHRFKGNSGSLSTQMYQQPFYFEQPTQNYPYNFPQQTRGFQRPTQFFYQQPNQNFQPDINETRPKNTTFYTPRGDTTSSEKQKLN